MNEKNWTYEAAGLAGLIYDNEQSFPLPSW